MIITCPHCQTKYQVTYEAIGSAGRKVQCAQCRRAWDQQPSPSDPSPSVPSAERDADRLFDTMEEDALDEVMSSEEKAALAEKPPSAPKFAEPLPKTSPRAPDPAEMQRRQAAFSRRQSAIVSRLPLARMRRAARFLGVIVLAGILAGGYFGREAIVERYPDLAGLYEAVGLGVNVVGLDFAELTTLKTLSGGSDVLMVSAQILGLNAKPVPVPPVVVSLLDASGHAVYEWSVSPQVPNLMAGERATFDTRLSLPPSEAVNVRLSFAGGSTQSEPQREPTAAAPMRAATAAPVDVVHAEPAAAAPASTAHH